MNNENTRGGTDKYLLLAEAIVRDFTLFQHAMSCHFIDIDYDDIDADPSLNLTLLSVLYSLKGSIFSSINQLVRVLRCYSSSEVNFLDIDDLYEFVDSNFRDYLKSHGYDLELFYEKKKDAEKA